MRTLTAALVVALGAGVACGTKVVDVDDGPELRPAPMDPAPPAAEVRPCAWMGPDLDGRICLVCADRPAEPGWCFAALHDYTCERLPPTPNPGALARYCSVCEHPGGKTCRLCGDTETKPTLECAPSPPR